MKLISVPRGYPKNQRGFTLIELLVVVAILGLISAIAIPNVLGLRGSAEEETARAELHNVLVAVTAGLSKSVTLPHEVVVYGSSGSGVQIIANPDAADNDPAKYLINDTEWAYYIAANGYVEQGNRVY